MTLTWLDIAGTLCGFDRDPMQGGATVVAQIYEDFHDIPSLWTTVNSRWTNGDQMWARAATVEEAQRAAEAAIGGEA